MSDTAQHEHSGHIYVTHFKAHVASGEYWTSADIVDCIVSYTVTQLMDIMTDPNSREGVEMLARVCILLEAFMHSQQQACRAAHAMPDVIHSCIVRCHLWLHSRLSCSPQVCCHPLVVACMHVCQANLLVRTTQPDADAVSQSHTGTHSNPHSDMGCGPLLSHTS